MSTSTTSSVTAASVTASSLTALLRRSGGRAAHYPRGRGAGTADLAADPSLYEICASNAGSVHEATDVAAQVIGHS
jgi:hypothetical protein